MTSIGQWNWTRFGTMGEITSLNKTFEALFTMARSISDKEFSVKLVDIDHMKGSNFEFYWEDCYYAYCD